MTRKADPTTKRVWALPALPERSPDAHKGDCGRVLVLAGSAGMAGAAFLASKAALRAGAGLVTCACPESVWPALSAKFTCVMTAPLPAEGGGGLSERARESLAGRLREADVLCAGPGLGRAAETGRLLKGVLSALPCPAVLDADALPHLPPSLGGRAVLTPHPGEMAALLGTTAAAVQADRRESAKRLARERQAVVVLKGRDTVVTDGLRLAVNETGNPGMATAGAGDVLSGILAGLLAQGMAPFEAARLGTHLHGLAGDLAAREKGMHSLIASDLLDFLPGAFLKCR